MNWINIKDKLPERGKEVLVWIDGHRNPAWSNNYALVVWLDEQGNFWEERHISKPLVGVIYWAEIEKPY
jgi:hypothetical protein